MLTMSKEEINELFNIVKDGSNIRDDDDTTVDTGFESFDSKLTSIHEELVKIPPNEKNMSREDLLKEIFGNSEEKVEKPIEKEVPKLDKLDVKIVQKEIVDKVFEEQVEPEKNIEKAKEMLQINEEKVDNTVKEEVSLVSNEKRPVEESKWLLESPSPKFNKLYEEKKYILTQELLKGGEIIFEKYYKELEDANVDINVNTYDVEEIGNRIVAVQSWRERIKQIQLKTNSQFFVWKEFMDLLPSVLARVEYERGKQEGIFFEHFKDMVSYWGHLQGLMKSCEIVSKHLDGAYASLSRQIVIAQPINESDRFIPSESKKPNPQLSRYDSLSQSKKEIANAIKPKVVGVQEVSF